MRALKIVIFILSFLALTAQLLRHVNERWITSRQSVLDKFGGPASTAVRESATLNELERQYALEFERATKEAAAQHAAAPSGMPQFVRPVENDPKVFALATAIRDWESKENEIRSLVYFWTCGFALWLLAAVCRWRGSDWMAVTLVTLAFVEMIYWTSPSFAGPQHELIRLLNYKLVFTGLSLALLLASWIFGALRLDSSQPKWRDVSAQPYVGAAG